MANDYTTDSVTIGGTWGGWEPSSDTVVTQITLDGSEFVKKEENMRGLYEIHAVNPKTEEIIGPILVVAKDEQGAILKADLPQEVRSNSEQYDILIECVGDVRAKKDVQKVEVVKD